MATGQYGRHASGFQLGSQSFLGDFAHLVASLKFIKFDLVDHQVPRLEDGGSDQVRGEHANGQLGMDLGHPKLDHLRRWNPWLSFLSSMAAVRVDDCNFRL